MLGNTRFTAGRFLERFDDLIGPQTPRHASQPLNFFGRISEVFRQS